MRVVHMLLDEEPKYSNSLILLTFQIYYLNLNVRTAHLTLDSLQQQAALRCYILVSARKIFNFRRFIVNICRFISPILYFVVSDTVTLFSTRNA